MMHPRAGTLEPNKTAADSPVRSADPSELGQTAIELAFFLPVILLIVTGITAFGSTLSNVQMLNSAVSIGAKQLSISRGQTTDPCALFVSTITSAAPALSAANMTFAYQFNSVPYSGTTCSSLSPSSGAASNLVAGQPIQVTVTYPCSLAAYAINYAQSCALTANFAELVQ